MADRRMFSREITETDAFLDLPLSSQALWFHLGLHADDDGMVGSPKSVARLVGASADDLGLLVAKGFLISFDSGVVALRHFRVCNTLKRDRIKPSVFQAELSTLELDDGKIYREKGHLNSSVPDGFQPGSTLDPNARQVASSSVPQVMEVMEGRELIKEERPAQRKRFAPPSLDEVEDYAKEKGIKLDAGHFMDYYMAQGWRLSNGNQMKDWRAAVRNWVKNDSAWARPKPKPISTSKEETMPWL